MALYRSYCNQLLDEFAYRANWTPNKPLKLGDVGFVKKGLFSKLFNLSDRDLPFIAEDGSGDDYTYKTSNAVSITAKVAGQTLPGSLLAKADAGVVVSFLTDEALLFHASGTHVSQVRDIENLGEAIKERYRQNNWKPEYLVVTEVIVADSATVAVSGGSDSVLELRANGSVAAADIANLSKASANFQATARTSTGFNVVATGGLTLLYKVHRLRVPWLPIFENIFALQGDIEPLDALTPGEILDTELEKAMIFGELPPEHED